MTEDHTPKVVEESAAAARQRPERKKRKWDQPAEHFLPAAAGLPTLNIGALPGATAYAATALPSLVPVPYSLPPQIAPAVLQNAAAAVQKLSQAKMPDEIIAREIVINDADPSVRYKLTKRQTQEEIQRCTSTVIITRGKYHPPNGQPDGEKPLYLHISAGSQLKETAERIKAVDLAASMIEKILRQGAISEATSAPFSSGQAVHPFSASVYLGFDADPSSNIATRIRGPNDQYINHIMNETGATVVLRGKDSGDLGSCHAESSKQPLHLYLTSMHLKSLEAAKLLAENLLDTIAAEFGASRISSTKVYGAVPPPQQLLAGAHTSETSVARTDVNSTSGSNILTGPSHSLAPTASTVATSMTPQSGTPIYSGVPPLNNMTGSIPPVTGGTFYSGYGDIYPQATPLQQVAFTLKHASSSTPLIVPAKPTLASTAIKADSSSDVEMDKRSQRRKFQELPLSKGPAAESQNSQQGSKFVKTGFDSLGNISGSSVAPPNKDQPGLEGMLPPDQVDMPSELSVPNKMPPSHLKSMPPPPSRNMPPPPPPRSMPPPPPRSMPPPPPKFPISEILSGNENRTSAKKDMIATPRSLDSRSISPPKVQPIQSSLREHKEENPKAAPVPDTLLKLMDYGDDDVDDDADVTNSMPQGNPTPSSAQKPFWAV